ncbi:MAG: prealbumin-like fold domain-containing protein, partial [Lachnospiraceae bacterium]|nr:prealbumin-like fold domain-containing protein [Lachnospiraceae bacterium]
MISFPGYSTIINFEEVTVTTSKKVNENYSNDTVTITKDSDGNYYMNYTLTFTVDAALSTLVLTDTLGAGQTLVDGSVQVNSSTVDSSHISYSTDSDGVTTMYIYIAGTDTSDIDYLYDSSAKDATYTVTYKVKLDEDVFEDHGKLKNSAYWTYNGTNSETKTTEVTPYKNISSQVSKEYEKTVYDDTTGYYTFYWKLTVTGDDLSGYVVTDTCGSNQTYNSSSFEIDCTDGTPAVTVSTTTYSDSTTGFTFTFPSDTTYSGTCVFTYTTTSTQTKDEMAGSGTVSFNNKVSIDDGDGNTGSDDGSTSIDTGTKTAEAEIEKNWTTTKDTVDTTTGFLYWEIKVTLADGVTELENVTVTDSYPYYYLNQDSWNGKQLTMKWDTIEVKDASGNVLTRGTNATDGDYTIDESTGVITFAKLTSDVTITGAVYFDFSSLSETDKVTFINSAVLKVNDVKLDEDSDTLTYTENDYRMTKTVTYDESTGLFNWTVVINPTMAEYADQICVYFSDTLPAGMEFVGCIDKNGSSVSSAINVALSVSDYGSGNGQNYTVTVQTKKVLDENDKETDQQTIEKVDVGILGSFHWYLSKTSYTITYQTKLSDTELARIATIYANGYTEQTFSYTNVAYLLNSSGGTLTSVEEEITYMYNPLSKSDLGIGADANYANSKDVFTYKVVANEEEIDLDPNSDTLTLYDTLGSDVSILLDSVSVTDENGADLSGVTISYEEDTLVITIPDQTCAVITFSVKAVDLGENTYTNTVYLVGYVTYSASVSEKHYIKEHSGTVNGVSNTITLSKLDADTGKALGGAEFALYQVNYDENTYVLGSETVVKDSLENSIYTSDEYGKVTFPLLTPGSLYYWEETEAPTGYVASSTEKHYFIVYAVATNQAGTAEDTSTTGQATTKANREAAEALAEAIENANSGVTVHVLRASYSWVVTNKQTGSITVTKNVTVNGNAVTAGDDTMDGDYLFGLFTVTEVTGQSPV